MKPHPFDRPRTPTPRLGRFLKLDAETGGRVRPQVHALRRALRPTFGDARLRRFLRLALRRGPGI